MAKRYRPVDRDQPFLFPPDMRDWLPADHPVHLVIRVVEQHLDTSAFHALRRAGGAGTAGYDPDMLVMVLVWAYAHQVTSSRRMEQLCHTDVAFRLICGGNLPDHVTLARFRAAFPGAIGEFFAQVLALCARLGMGRLGVVALDGTKIAASTGNGLPGRDPVPASDHSWVKRAAAGLERAQARAAAAAARAADRERSRSGPGPVRNITDPDSRLMPARGGGFIQGYNAQLVTSEDGLIIATRLTGTTGTTGDTTWLKPMMQDAEHAAALITAARPPGSHDHGGSGRPGDDDDAGRGTSIGGNGQDGGNGGPGYAAGYAGPIGLFLADAADCSEDNLTTPGPDRLIATGKLRDLEKAARGDPAGGSHRGQATRAMAARLQTPDGIDAYRHRGHIAKTPNGDIKHNKGFRQFSMRGKPKASAEWQLVTATASLLKAITTGHLTHDALDNLASQTGYPPRPPPRLA